ncbi:MAG TPA: hypothetical protein DCK87_06555 [Desulfotomaculum sp.]|nr:hypothetical protein [Desulfotomaculum sp.]
MGENQIYPPPYFVDWAITNKCNLNCLHCRGMPAQELTSEETLEVAAQIPALSPQWVIIEGGEPLLRPEIFEVIKLCGQEARQIYLITNGMLLNESIVAQLASLKVKVMLSVDGAVKKSYEEVRRGANFNRLKEAGVYLKNYGIFDACNITLGQHNYRQIEDMFNFAAGLGVPKIVFLGLKPCGNYQDYVLSGENYARIIPLVAALQAKFKIEIVFDEPFFKPFLAARGIPFTLPDANGIVVSSLSNCIFGEYLFIESNGEVKPCTFAPVSLGSLKEKPLKEIWEETQNSRLINEIKDLSTRQGRCQKCKYLNICGGCRSRTYALTGDWFKADPACPFQIEVG